MSPDRTSQADAEAVAREREQWFSDPEDNAYWEEMNASLERGDPQHAEFSRAAAEHILGSLRPGKTMSEQNPNPDMRAILTSIIDLCWSDQTDLDDRVWQALERVIRQANLSVIYPERSGSEPEPCLPGGWSGDDDYMARKEWAKVRYDVRGLINSAEDVSNAVREWSAVMKRSRTMSEQERNLDMRGCLAGIIEAYLLDQTDLDDRVRQALRHVIVQANLPVIYPEQGDPVPDLPDGWSGDDNNCEWAKVQSAVRSLINSAESVSNAVREWSAVMSRQGRPIQWTVWPG